MPDLVVVVPSRGRPQAVAELAQQCAKTCTADTVLLVVLDTDDPTAPEYIAPAGTQVFFTYTAPAGHVGAINHGATAALRDFAPFAIAKLDDDHRPRTVGWDSAYLEALRALGTGIVYGNDLLQGRKLPTAPALTADIVQTLGYMGPPALRHLYVDDFWRDLGTQAGCLRYLPNVVVEHMHPLAGKAAVDDGYRRANAPEQFRADGDAYETYRRESLAADVAKVAALLAPAG
ncbi:MAG TPA: glycosyltransferase [Nocardioidaceae bacterium]|nr:glycosyltransferase [Nocardioidaceae bacterium]